MENDSDGIARRPNIVMLCADQWRGDCLGVAGHPDVHTPYLDQLAVGGADFDSAFSACPSCIAARASLLTGRSPQSCGRVGYKDGVPWRYEGTLPEILAENGYHCQAVGKMHVYPERAKLGFHDVILHDGYLHYVRRNVADLADLDDYMPYLRAETGRPDAEYFEHGVGCNSHLARPWDKAEYLHPTNFVASRCVDYIAKRKNDRRPFFLFCSWHRPHPPYDPPQWAFDLYDRRPDLELPPRGEWSRRLERYATGRPDSPYARLKPRELRRARSGYYGLMTQIDYQVDRIIEALVDAGKDSDTLLVFVSDHGELLGDHDLFRKSLPYEGSARIPLIFNGPGIPRGSKISGVASLQDLMPTLLDYLGIPIPRHVDGLSLMPMIRGEKSAVREFLHGEHAYEGQSVQFLCDGEWKYIWWSGDGHEELFNRRRDPQELEELSASEPERVAILRAELAKRLVGRPEGYSDGAELFAGRDPINVLPWAETGMPS